MNSHNLEKRSEQTKSKNMFLDSKDAYSVIETELLVFNNIFVVGVYLRLLVQL